MGRFDDNDGFEISEPDDEEELPVPDEGIQRRYIVDGKVRSSESEEITPPKGLTKEQLLEWIEKNTEGDVVVNVMVRADVDLPWPIRHAEIHQVGEGYAIKLTKQRTSNSFAVRIHPSMVGRLSSNEADRLAAQAPLDSKRGRMKAVERRGELVKFSSDDGKESEWVYL
ncbi:MAG: hypothetical protein E6Q97_37175 [Desulfurellales bacterium]|nr:MAG: hypothetical protein E6Q97_37175 [Desulfurellales bacterium]